MNKLMILIAILSIWYKYSRCENNHEFIKLKEENGILLSCRWVPAPGNGETREIKAAFEVEAEPSGIIELLRNEQQALLWMRGVKEVKMHSTGNPAEWYVYLLYNIPWPLNKQDCIIHYRLAADSGEGLILLKMEGDPEYVGVKAGIERIPHLSGSWKISQAGIGKCRVEYTVFSFQKPRFPRWATDPIVQSNLYQSMISFRELAGKTKKSHSEEPIR